MPAKPPLSGLFASVPHGQAFNRRFVILGTASLGAVLAAQRWLPNAMAQALPTKPAEPAMDAAAQAFWDFSKKLTDHSDLSALTANRILQAASAVSADFAPHITALTALTGNSADAAALLAAADAAGLKEHALAISAAWYTGTVTGPEKSQVVAYQQALMYRPVSDGLPVPTYCFNGPLWWTQKPPGV